jgi:L-rhamnose mutarotase
MRTCLALDLVDDPALIAAYEHYHRPDQIWPDIPAGIRAAGILDMQIYRLGNHLFMIAETADGVDLDAAFRDVGTYPRQPEWAALMAGFQQRLPEAQPGEHWAKMKPVFRLSDSPADL